MSRHWPLVEVLGVAPAQRLDVVVDDVGARRGQREREVLAAADEDVTGEGRSGDAARLVARPGDVDFEHEARVEVADLRAPGHNGAAAGRALGCGHDHVAGLGRPTGPGCAGHGGGLKGAVVHDHVAPAALRDRRVGETPVDRHRGARHAPLAQVVEHRQALARAQLLLQAVEEHRRRRLPAPALAHELALQGVEGEDVGAGDGLGVRARRPQVSVGALQVDVDVVEHRPALLALRLQHLGLLGHLGLGLRRGLEVQELGGQLERVQARGIHRGGAGVVPRLLEQQPPILRGHPAHGEGDVIIGGTPDVGHVELVALDADARTAGDPLFARGARRAPERLGLEEARQVALGHAVEQRREAVVHLGLAIRGRRCGDAAVLACGKDVQRGIGVVASGCSASREQHQRRRYQPSRCDGSSKTLLPRRAPYMLTQGKAALRSPRLRARDR